MPRRTTEAWFAPEKIRRAEESQKNTAQDLKARYRALHKQYIALGVHPTINRKIISNIGVSQRYCQQHQQRADHSTNQIECTLLHIPPSLQSMIEISSCGIFRTLQIIRYLCLLPSYR